MGIQPDSSPFGSQTVTGPGWPNVNEEQLEEAAAPDTKLATKISVRFLQALENGRLDAAIPAARPFARPLGSPVEPRDGR